MMNLTFDERLSKEEVNSYVDELKTNNPDKLFKSIHFDLTEDGEIEAKYTYDSVPFARIRRITGYLVGTLDRFNDAKQAEVRDRVKHSLISTGV